MPPGSAAFEDAEARRLAALHRYAVLDSAPEQEFDDLTHLAAGVIGVPIALISLLDESRQWFKSRFGLDVVETPRTVAFCDHTIQGTDIFEVTDATRDARFATNPLVTGDPHIRFYAGTPLSTPDGYRVGTLCVIDRQPRVLTTSHRQALIGLARLAMRQLELRLEGRRHAVDAAFQRAIFDSAATAIIATDLQGVIVRLNPAAERLLGWRAAEVVLRETPLLFHDRGEVRQRAAELSLQLGRTVTPDGDYFRTVLTLGLSDKRDWTFIRRDGTGVPVQVHLGPVHDALGQPIGFLGIIDDVSKQRAALDDLRRSEASFRALSVSAPVGIFRTDAAGKCLYTNERWQQLGGLSEREALGDGWARAIVEDDREEVFAAWSASASSRTEFSREFRMVGQGAPRWVHSRARAIVSETGEVLGHVGTVEDITDRRAAHDATAAALHEKDVLLREIHHRVKNNLQIISSLLRLQGKRVRDPRDLHAFTDARVRLRSMMLVHEMLYQSSARSRIDLADYLGRLLRDVAGSDHSGRIGPELRLECAALDVHSDQALPLGMLVTELVTNAMKYAYRDGRSGAVDVRAARHAGRLVVAISDDGAGISDAVNLEQPDTFGWQLIRMLGAQLQADITVRRSQPTAVEIAFPLMAAD